MRYLLFFLLVTSSLFAQLSEQNFKVPLPQYKPMPLWHINGELTKEGIRKQMIDAKTIGGFSGVAILPLADKSETKPGTSPKYLSEQYFDRYRDILDIAAELDMKVIMYDDNDFPSGMAGGLIEKSLPQHSQKKITNIEKIFTGPISIIDSVPGCIKLMSVVAFNPTTFERVDLRKNITDGILKYNLPKGEWKLIYFILEKEIKHKKYEVVDYMDTIAVRHMIENTYDKYYQRFKEHFGKTIEISFFDDVGFWRHPRMWTGRFNEKFFELNGYDPAPYYPALWYNIGPKTEAIRNAFFNTRAELLSEGFPRLVAEWAKKHNIKDTGHPPGNYDPTPIDMNADIFKFYRHTAIPLCDAIIDYQFGQDGHKLISSAADYYDKQKVAVEVFGAFKETIFDSIMLYRPVFDILLRGINFVMPHGMWYNPDLLYIPPLVSPFSPKVAPALNKFSNFVGRACTLLDGGSRVSEIAVLYPFEELAGYFHFDNPLSIRQGFLVSDHTDYLKVSNILTNQVRNDFTFVHPELLLDKKYVIKDKRINLTNHNINQSYKVLFMTGANTISLKTLRKIKAFYDQGGTIISTSKLPYKSSELNQDKEVIKIITAMFGKNPLHFDTTSTHIIERKKNGNAIFIPKPNQENISTILSKYHTPDIKFVNNPQLSSNFGKFSYIHKLKNGKNIFYFANSNDESINTEVLIKGKLKLQKWNPHNGEIDKNIDMTYLSIGSVDYTKIKLSLKGVDSIFFIE